MQKTKIEKMQTLRILKFLHNKKIISDDKKKRNRTYFFDGLIKIVN